MTFTRAPARARGSSAPCSPFATARRLRTPAPSATLPADLSRKQLYSIESKKDGTVVADISECQRQCSNNPLMPGTSRRVRCPHLVSLLARAEVKGRAKGTTEIVFEMACGSGDASHSMLVASGHKVLFQQCEEDFRRALQAAV